MRGDGHEPTCEGGTFVAAVLPCGYRQAAGLYFFKALVRIFTA